MRALAKLSRLIKSKHLRPERYQCTYLPPAIKPPGYRCEICGSIVRRERVQKRAEKRRNHNDEGKSEH